MAYSNLRETGVPGLVPQAVRVVTPYTVLNFVGLSAGGRSSNLTAQQRASWCIHTRSHLAVEAVRGRAEGRKAAGVPSPFTRRAARSMTRPMCSTPSGAARLFRPAKRSVQTLQVLAYIVGAIRGVRAVVKVDRNRVSSKISRRNNRSTWNAGNICGVVDSGSADALEVAGATEKSELTVLSVDRHRETVHLHGPMLEMAYELKYRASAPVGDCNVIERNDCPKRAVLKFGDAAIVDEPIVDASADARNEPRKSIRAGSGDASDEGGVVGKITAVR